MKKLYFILVTVLLVALVGCSKEVASPKDYKFKAGKFTDQDLTFYDLKTKKIISYGMSKSDLEEILGAPTQTGSFPKIDIYDGLNVKFRDDQLVGMVVNDSDRFVTMRDIAIGDSREQVEEVYGEASNEANDLNYIIYKKGSKFIYPYEVNDSTETTGVYYISFTFDYDDEVSMIFISDYDFAVNLK